MIRQVQSLLILLAVMSFFPRGMFAQFIITKAIDYSRFPTLSAQVYAFDSTGSSATLDVIRDRLIIEKSENSTSQKLAVISCEQQQVQRVVSSALCLDISTLSVAEAMKLGLTAWTNSMNKLSETAVTVFSAHPYIIQDFTNDTARLLQVANAIQPLPGTNLNESFLDEFSGGLAVIAKGKYRRILVVATDGLSPINDSIIIEQANRLSAVVYILVIGNKATKELQRCAMLTDGICIDNIPLQKVSYYFTVLSKLAHGSEPCTFTWQSDVNACGTNRVTGFKVASFNISTYEYSWVIPERYVRRLKVDETTKYMGNVKKDEVRTTNFILSATGNDVVINSITCENPLFTITTPLNNYVLKKDSTITISCSFTGTDTIFRRRITPVLIMSNSCNVPTIFIEANSTENPAITPRLASFRGGETIFAGTDTLIHWSGVMPTDSVRLEFSLDEAGSEWTVIDDKARWLAYKWKIPDTISKARLRIALTKGQIFHYSGSTFSIIKPNVRTVSIVCPPTRIKEQNEFIVTDVITNKGNVLLRIDSVLMNSPEFHIVSGVPAGLVPNSVLKILEVRFIPTDTGVRTGSFTFYTNLGIFNLSISGIGVTQRLIPIQVINFGLVPLGITKDTIVQNAICLGTNTSLTIRKLLVRYPDAEQFLFSQKDLPLTLTLQEFCTHLSFQFKPTRFGRACARVLAETDDKEVYEFVLFGEGTCSLPGQITRLVLPDTTRTLISEETHIPIRMEGIPQAFLKMKRPYQLQIRFNKSILLPISPTPFGEEDGDERLVTIRGIGFEIGDTLTTFHANTAWGNIQQFPITIQSFRWLDECPDPIITSVGKVLLSNVCYAGNSARLYIASDTLAFTSVSPNPANTYIDLVFSLRESGTTTLTICDVFGRVIQESINVFLESGTHRCRTQVDNLPAGQYIAVLSTPTKKVTTLIGVTR